MTRQFRNIGRFAVVAALCGWMTSVAAVADEESSVLVEKQVEPAAKAPVLSPPANRPTLPPPERTSAEELTTQPAATPARRPFMRPAEPKTRDTARAELTGEVESIPAPANSTADIVIHPALPIKYDTDSDARRMYRHSGEVELIMVTQNPADGCFYEIPLCIPACCTGEPIMSGGRGIFGRGVVEYCWPCGFRAIVKFRHILGDVRVDYEGD